MRYFPNHYGLSDKVEYFIRLGIIIAVGGGFAAVLFSIAKAILQGCI